jgi:hypothetical protein
VLSTFCQLTQSHFDRDEVLKYRVGNETVASDVQIVFVLSRLVLMKFEEKRGTTGLVDSYP